MSPTPNDSVVERAETLVADGSPEETLSFQMTLSAGTVVALSEHFGRGARIQHLVTMALGRTLGDR